MALSAARLPPILVSMNRVLIIDNYDSFTYNLVQLVATCHEAVAIEVVRNDMVTAEQVHAYEPTHLVFSPGPGRPENAGNSSDIIAYWAGKVPMLGVCLGHQCIGQVLGGRVKRARRCMHGKTSLIYHDGKTIFSGLSRPFRAMRYHSLIVEECPPQGDFVVSAWTESEEIMAIRDERLRIEAVQFHPESFATAEGSQLMQNFLDGPPAGPSGIAKRNLRYRSLTGEK